MEGLRQVTVEDGGKTGEGRRSGGVGTPVAGLGRGEQPFREWHW